MYGGDFKRKPESVISKWATRFLDVVFPPHFPSIKVIGFPIEKTAILCWIFLFVPSLSGASSRVRDAGNG